MLDLCRDPWAVTNALGDVCVVTFIPSSLSRARPDFLPTIFACRRAVGLVCLVGGGLDVGSTASTVTVVHVWVIFLRDRTQAVSSRLDEVGEY